MKNKKGFTLVELLVVIAIIGILSSVAIVNLNTARDKARIASVQGNLAGIVPAIVLCNDANQTIREDGVLANLCDGTAAPTAGTSPLCVDGTTDIGSWPELPGGTWTYGMCSHTIGTGDFFYSAGDGGTTVTCNQNGCTTT